jgi:predicted O-methyltransferase YrrM
MRNSGNGSPEVFTHIAEEEVRAERPPTDHGSAALTTRRLFNGLEALAALPYYLLVCSITQPRRMARFLENLFEYQRAEKVHSGNQGLIPTVDPEQLFPGLFHQKVSLLDLGSRPGGTTFFETYLMACLIKSLGARTIFEFGTFEGRTTLQLALNAPEEATIYTLDLPECSPATRFDLAYSKEASSRKLPIGGLFQQRAESGKIMQLLLDSANVDFEPFRGKVDFVFIDADHGMSYVKSDSENAFSMLSPQGVVLWHDYGGRWPDVARYLREVAGKKKLFHLDGTSLVLHGPLL